MASGEASIIVRLIDKASSGLKGIGGGLDALKRNFLAVSAAVAGLTAFMASSVRAFAEQEAASKKLEIALKNQGISSKTVAKNLEEYASQLQKTTAFGDDAITQGMALLTTFGITGDTLKSATKAALDLSSGLGIDLHSAMMLIGKAGQGQVEMLGRYGIKIKEGLKGSEAFAAVLGKVNERFGGAAQAQAQTFSGQMSQLANSFNDLQEMIGQAAIPVLKEWVRWGNSAIDVVSRMFNANKDSLSVNATALSQQKEELEILRRAFVAKSANQQITSRSFESMAKEINAKQRLIKELEKQVAAENKLTDAKGGAGGRAQQLDEESAKFVAAKQLEVDTYFSTEEQKKLIQAEADAAKLAKLGETQIAEQFLLQGQADFEASIEEKKRRKKQEANAAFVSSTQLMLSGIMGLNAKHNKELIALQKAAGVASVMINTAQAIMGVWKWAAAIPFGQAIAAVYTGLITAVAGAQLAAIGGAQLAEGGVVMPRSGGTLATIGEAGQAEAVIPLGSGRAQEQLREALGGGITINLYAQYADKSAFDEFVGKIEEGLFMRARNGKSVLDIS